ncbi:MAG: pyridoxamine 5'-phosphate oxidase family protein [Caulobacterales bacterium]
MAKQRDAVKMSDEEILKLYDECKSLNVATIGKDGYPHQTVLWYAPHEGTLLFETYGKSQKVLNLQRDPRISVQVEAGEEYNELRGVSIRGKAEIVSEEPRLSELMLVCVKRNHPDVPESQQVELAKGMARKRFVVVVHPERTMSWDHRKIAPSAH